MDADLYRALKVEAARSDRSVRDVIAEAAEAWLRRMEDEEDRRSAQAALEEYERLGGVSAAEHFEHLAAEVRATYGRDDSLGDP